GHTMGCGKRADLRTLAVAILANVECEEGLRCARGPCIVERPATSRAGLTARTSVGRSGSAGLSALPLDHRESCDDARDRRGSDGLLTSNSAAAVLTAQGTSGKVGELPREQPSMRGRCGGRLFLENSTGCFCKPVPSYLLPPFWWGFLRQFSFAG